MKIRFAKSNNAPFRAAHDGATPLSKRIGCFAVVKAIHPSDLTVDVVTDTGIELTHRRVASFQWVIYKEGGSPELTGKRDLPPVGSYVFCLMPNGTLDTLFVLCSMFSTEAAHGAYFGEDDNDADAQNTILDVEKSGWQKSTDIRTGTKIVQNRQTDETIKLEINQEAAGSEGESSSSSAGEDDSGEVVTLTIHGTTVTIDKNGITLATDGAINVDAANEEASAVTKHAASDVSLATDKTLSISATEGITITTDKTIEIDAGDAVVNKYAGDLTISSDGNVTISATQTGLLSIGNAVATLGAMVNNLLTYLQSLTTVGSPATQTVSPATIANLAQLQAQWQQVFS